MKFSKKRLLGYLRSIEYMLERASKNPDQEKRKSQIITDLINLRVLIHDIEFWERTEETYGYQIDRFSKE